MKKAGLLLFFASFWMALNAQVQPTHLQGLYEHGWTDISFTDNSLSSPNVSARVHYPASVSGFNAVMVQGQYPVIAFGHGFNMFYDDYENLCGHLASWGYLVIAPNVQNGFAVDHQEYARELAASIRHLYASDVDTASFFYASVDSVSGAFGHSMGGGASCLIPSVWPDIDAIAGLAAAETNPSAISALSSSTKPLLQIGGTADNVAGEAGNQIPMYNASAGEKVRLSFIGAGHCKFSDGPTICDVVSAPGSLDNARQQELSNKYLTAFFQYYLRGATAYKTYLCGDSVQSDVANGVLNQESNLTGCPTAVSMEAAASQPIRVYPNPATDIVRVEGMVDPVLYDSNGKEVQLRIESNLLWVRTLPSGLYLLKDRWGSEAFKLMIQH